MNYITILDYSKGRVYVRKISKNYLNLDGDNLFDMYCKKLNLIGDDCYYILTNEDNFLDININNN